jgi:O-antigen ligase
MEPFLALPAYALVGLAALLAIPVEVRNLGSASGGGILVLAFAGWIAWRCLALPPDPALAQTDFLAMLGCVAAWAAVTMGLADNRSKFLWLAIFVAVGLGQAGVAAWQMSHRGFSMPFWWSEELRGFYEGRFWTRARGLFLNPNQFAWMMNALALLTLSVGAWGRVRVVARVVLLYVAAVFIVMSVLSASRGGLISLAAGLVVFALASGGVVLFVMRRNRVWMLGGMLLAVTLVGVAGWLAFSMSWVAQGRVDVLSVPGVLDSTLQGQVDPSKVGDPRGFFLENGVRLFESAPVVGAGPGMFLYAARAYRDPHIPGDPIFAHDDWLQLAAEYGFVGLVLGAAVLVAGVAVGMRAFGRAVARSHEAGGMTSSRGAFALGGACVLVTFAVHSLTDFNMHIPANALLAAMALGLAMAPRAEARSLRGIASGVLILAGTVVAICAMAIFLNRDARAQWEVFCGANALARGEGDVALARANAAVAANSSSPLAHALRGRALYAYESWLIQKSEPAYEPEPPGKDDADEGEDDATGAVTAEATPSEEPAADETAEEDADKPVLSATQRERIYRDAAESFARAAAIQPLERSHRMDRAKALAETGASAEAHGEFAAAIGLDPNVAYAWAAYGDFLSEHGETPRALRIYQLGSAVADGVYCGEQWQDIQNELHPPPEDAPE